MNQKNFTIVWGYKTSLTTTLLLKWSVQIQESERSCICVLGDFRTQSDTPKLFNQKVV